MYIFYISGVKNLKTFSKLTSCKYLNAQCLLVVFVVEANTRITRRYFLEGEMLRSE